MSRLAKKPIQIPEKAEVALSGNIITVTGPAGTLSRALHPSVAVTVQEKEIHAVTRAGFADANAHLGTAAAHIRNMLQGSREPFAKKLIVEGIGFKADVKESEIVLALGFSHPVRVRIPQGIKVTAEKNVVAISGADIELVSQFAARLRSFKPPEPYKGKGIRYDGEVIKRKQGKKAV